MSLISNSYTQGSIFRIRDMSFNTSQKTIPSNPNKITIGKIYPLIAPRIVDILCDYLRQHQNAKMLEFGSGNSTVFFAKRCKHITSLEHNKEWYERVLNTLNEKKLSIENYIFHDLPYYDVCTSFCNKSFDIIIVDGRNRKGCIVNSLRLLKPGGLLVLDDCQRKYYHDVFKYMKGWETEVAPRPKLDIPGGGNRAHTRIWVKPKL